MIRRLDVAMIFFLLVSTALMVLGHEDPLARKALCQTLNLCLTDAPTPFWSKLSYDLGLGALVSILFYFLLVRLPENQKRRRLRSSLRAHYSAFKERSIAVFVGAADGSYSPEFVETLLVQSSFRDYFKEAVAEDQTRWDAAFNKFGKPAMDELLTEMDILREEISYVLGNVDIEVKGAFPFLKQLSHALHATRNAAAEDYESRKQLFRFFWEILSGWSWVKGYQKADVVEKMIKAI